MFNNISDQVNDVPTKKVYVGTGDTAIQNTLILMREIINSSYQNYYVRRFAEKIVQDATTLLEKVQAVFDFLAFHTKYVKDPHGLEMLKSPLVSLQLIEVGEQPMLDCDDSTILSLSLLRSIGFPVSIKAIGVDDTKRFKHVYGMVLVKDKWIPFDGTMPKHGLGWEYNMATRDIRLEVK